MGAIPAPVPSAEAYEILRICRDVGKRHALNGMTLTAAEDVASAAIPAALNAWASWDGRGSREARTRQLAGFAAIRYVRYVTSYSRHHGRRPSGVMEQEQFREDRDADGRNAHTTSTMPATDAGIEAESTRRIHEGLLEIALSLNPGKPHRPSREREIVGAMRSHETITAAARSLGLHASRVSNVLASLRDRVAEAACLNLN